jgi:hypothetical protein
MIAEVVRMDCAHFEEVLSQMDCAHKQAAAIPEGALAHAESCGDCARLLLEKLFRAQAVSGGVRAVRE